MSESGKKLQVKCQSCSHVNCITQSHIMYFRSGNKIMTRYKFYIICEKCKINIFIKLPKELRTKVLEKKWLKADSIGSISSLRNSNTGYY